ncbi:hypothetical protein ACO22_04253 [Paracoccidioides brasiliensis]|uniref:Indole-diterpene biosynthesis protein PaxU n=1 Tax=Paracoccidioides brasiliensis TaxID=121759 RepID=A0A1D2JDW1_PARBR|nr:hypothetical protein ACO22_04253 [Paracoccidioides brasiliensis]
MASTAEIPSDLFTSFSKLSPAIYLRDGPTSTPSSLESPPPTICLLFWMDAVPRHAAKFVQEYIKILPNARIICMTTTSTDFLFKSSNESRRMRVNPLISALPAEYREVTGEPLPIKSMLLDSAPGRSTFARGAKAFSYALPNLFLARILGMCLIWVALVTFWAVYKIKRVFPPIEAARDLINNPKFISIRAARCYVYSKVDELIYWKDVEEHAAEATGKGWRVSTEIFDAPHVGNMRADPERYWKLAMGLILQNSIDSE